MEAPRIPELSRDEERTVQAGDVVDFLDGNGDVLSSYFVKSIEIEPGSPYARLEVDSYISLAGLDIYLLEYDGTTGKYTATDDPDSPEWEVVFRTQPEIGQNQEAIDYLERHFYKVMFEVATGKRQLSFDLVNNPVFNNDMDEDEFFEAAITYWQWIIFEPYIQDRVNLVLQGVEDGTIDRTGLINARDIALNSLVDINGYLETGHDFRATIDEALEFAETYKEVRDEYMRRLETAVKPAR